MIDFIPPNEMSPQERRNEITAILAAGYLRMKSQPENPEKLSESLEISPCNSSENEASCV